MKISANILIVDDEPRNLDVLETILDSPEYRLVRARTADEALLALVDGEFAAIVMDIRMPGMNGLELANLVKQRKRTQHIPIIFLTAYYQEDKYVLEGYGVGAVDYLTKPVNPQILKSKVAVFADLFRSTRALAAANQALELEVIQRQQAEEALRRANSELEERVQQRTADLTQANLNLSESERALRQSEEQLTAASRAKDGFLAALSHELRTPLNPVLLLASEAAEDPSLPAAVRADFASIRNNVELEARLIDDLLDLTGITHGKLGLHLGPVDVHTALQNAIATARADIDRKRIDLTLLLGAPQHQVIGDEVRLQQIFWNLLKNAVKFTPEHGRITVETCVLPHTGTLTIKLIDTGIGMTTDEIERVFHAFSQGDHASGTGSHRFGGMGLGLTISRMLVELHSGAIHAASAGRGKGATFIVRLPLTQQAVSETEPAPAVLSSHGPPPAAHPSSPALRRILLVEDHEPTRTALAQLLRRRHYEVVTAASVSEATSLAENGDIDLLISDIGLPDGNGFDLMSKLRERRPMRGIALTGYGMEQDIARSQAVGFGAHLTKPVRVQFLEKALAAVAAASPA